MHRRVIRQDPYKRRMTGISTAPLNGLACGVLCSGFDVLAVHSFAGGTDADYVLSAIQVLQQHAGLGR